MKFFTREWWASGGEVPPNVVSEYQHHWESIKHLLPAAIVEFDRDHSIHDANVKGIECDFTCSVVKLKLLGWDRDFQNRIYYTLVFEGVVNFEQFFPQEVQPESELGDLGYWEFDMKTDAVQMRMLFASDAEFSLEFRDFEFTYAAAKA